MRYRSVFLILLSLCLISEIYTQNYYDLRHRVQFAHASFETRKFPVCVRECEQILNDSLPLTLADSLHYFSGISLMRMEKRESASLHFAKVSPALPVYYEKAGLYMNYRNLMTGNYETAYNGIAELEFGLETPPQNPSWFLATRCASSLLMHRFGMFDTLLNTSFEISADAQTAIEKMGHARQVYLKKKPKSAALSVALSTLLPGAGKCYAGSWGSGILTLFITTTSALQAYEGFRRGHFRSAQFWLFGAMGAGWYISGIYGSVIQSKKFNAHIETNFRNAVLVAFSVPFERFFIR